MKIKKLALKKTTIVELTAGNLHEIVGGQTLHTQCVDGQAGQCVSEIKGRVEINDSFLSCPIHH